MSRIMIIDDAPIITQPIEAALKREGYETVTAANGQEALQEIANARPDLILLDLAMPVMDGITFLKQLRKNSSTRDIPVIMLTAIADKPRVIQAAQLGVRSYLLKSRFSLTEMLDQIAQHLERAGGQAASAPKTQAKTSPSLANASNQAAPAAGAVAASSAAATSEPAPESVQPAVSATPAGTSSGAAPNAPPGAPEAAAGEPNLPSPDEYMKDDPVEALKALKPLMTRSEVMDRIEGAGELKGLSPAVTQVLKLTGNARCSIEQVAKAISQDHGIALKVLKLANSAVYTRGEPVDSVHTAVTRIGLGQIRQTVLNLAVIDQFNADGLCPEIEVGQFWEHAIATGLIAAEIGHALEMKDVDAAFTMGLIHDVGRLYFATQFGEVYAHVIKVARDLELPLEVVEQRLMLYNHADVMDRVLHSWKFPKQLINPIVFHHLSAGNVRRNAPRQLEEVAILGLANRLAHAMMLGSSGNEVIYPTEDICDLLKIGPEVIERIVGITREETDKVKFTLLASSNAANWPQLRQVHREALTQPMNPVFISALPQFDAYRIFCEELTVPQEGAAPNLGVLHLTSARDRVPLTSAFRKAEQEAGVSNLPLLILSPAGKIVPENALLSGRAYELLATPCAITKFIAAANRLLGGAGTSTESAPSQAA